MEIFNVDVEGVSVSLFYNKRTARITEDNAGNFASLLMRVVKGFPVAVADLARDRSPANELRHAVDLVTEIENMSVSASIGYEERKRILGTLVFFFRSTDARTAIHCQTLKMPQNKLSAELKMNSLQVSAEMCDVFEFC